MTLYLFNLLDLITTLLAIRMGAVETNPLMAAVIAASPVCFVLIKLAVLPLCWLIRHNWAYKWACVGYGIFLLKNIIVIGVLLT